MSDHTNETSDKKALILGGKILGGMFAVSIPLCLTMLTMVGPLKRLYIAVLATLLLMVLGVLVIGVIGECKRTLRSLAAARRAYLIRRLTKSRSATDAGVEPLAT